MIDESVAIGRPRKKYRIIIQQRQIRGDKKEASRSFMIYDYTGMSTIDSIRKRLQRSVNK